MRMHGYCTGCRRMRPVSVNGHALALAAAKGTPHIPEGLCVECEDEEVARVELGRPARPWPLGHPRRVRLERLIRDPDHSVPEPMIDARRLRISTGRASARDRVDVARDDATIALLKGRPR